MADCQAGREQNALALRLRHLAGECRDLRRGNEWERKWEGVFFQLNEVFGAAICARSVPEPILESVNKNPQAIRGGLVLGREFKLPFAVLGYHPSTFTSFVEPDEYDDETHCMSLGERYVILRPGYVSSAWPGVFPEIESPVPDGVSLKDAAEDLYRSETFSIVGFYAMACDLLAEWIYKQSAEDGSAAGGGEPEAEGGTSDAAVVRSDVSSYPQVLNRLRDLIDELSERVNRFSLPAFDLNGVDDVLAIAGEIKELQAAGGLPPMLVMDRTTNPQSVRFRVFDPEFPGRPGVLGFIAMNTGGSGYVAGATKVNLPVLRDYLSRSKRYICRQLQAGNYGGGGEPEAENESRSEMSLQSAALDAVVRSGLAGVVQQAAGASAIDRASAAMRKLFETDRGEYGSWSAERWAEHLGVSKKTVVGTRNKPNKAWKDVMAWRASNKAERVSKETLK